MPQSKITLEEIRISYLFNIGSPVDDKDLEAQLIKQKYKINTTRQITRPPLQATILTFARKGDVDIIYAKDNLPTFLGVLGKRANTVVDEFEKLTFMLNEIDGLLTDQSVGIEAVLTLNVFDKHVKPDTSLAYFASPQVKKFSEQFQTDYVMDNFTLRSKHGEDNTTIHIAPLYRDRRFFYMQLLLRSNSTEKIFEFVEGQEKYIRNALSVLSEDEPGTRGS